MGIDKTGCKYTYGVLYLVINTGWTGFFEERKSRL